MKSTRPNDIVGFRDAALRARIENFIAARPGPRTTISAVVRAALETYLDANESAAPRATAAAGDEPVTLRSSPRASAKPKTRRVA